ncbi:MAG: DUF4118 domain-containing protein [Proteobacteria bacterium]|nr:DUF4118 domain-containing protein [Pseudomonadota bacterium]
MPDKVPKWGIWTAELVDRLKGGWRPYLLAVAAVVLATVLRAALHPLIGDRLFFTTYFPAIGIVAALGGLLPGLVALVLSMGLAWFLFLPPALSFDGTKIEALQLGLFLVACTPLVVVAALLNVAIGWLGQQRRTILRVQDAEARQHRLLVKELEHRLGNLFGVVQLIAIRTLQGELEPAEARAAFRERIAALASASSASLGERPNVRGLVERQVKPYRSQVDIDHCEAIELEPKAAQQLALICHELATNAVKYGALSVPGGRVSIACKVRDADGDPTFEFTWSEWGGPAPATPPKRGFGSEVLEDAPRYSGATVSMTFDPPGLRYTYRHRLAWLSR